MTEVDYYAPATLADALALLATPADTRVLAGGTDLIVQMRSGRIAPARVVDVKRIGELVGIARDDAGGWRIGAATPCAVIGEHAALKSDWPGVVEAAKLIGSTQVQGRASVGGNLCNASPAADSAPALVAAGARCVISGPGGTREIAVEALPAGPGRTTLAAGELLVALRLPARVPRSADAYLRLIPRTEMDIAVVGAGVCLTVGADGRITAARVALGAVASTVVLAAQAGDALVGTSFDDGARDRLKQAVAAACRPIDDKRGTAAYRTRVAGVLAVRAADIACRRAIA